MINKKENWRDNYCKNCDRSIYSDSILKNSCDVNIEDKGRYLLSGNKCYCKIINGKRAEKYPWEEEK